MIFFDPLFQVLFFIFIGEQATWEKFEAKRVMKILNIGFKKESRTALFRYKMKMFSWIIEVMLHKKGNELIRERGYVLISRIHSIGGAIAAIVLGMSFSLLYFLYIKQDCCEMLLSTHKEIVFDIFITIGWIFIIFLLLLARASSVEGYRCLIKHFIDLTEADIRPLKIR